MKEDVTHHRMKEHRCRRCGELLDAATSIVGDHRPSRGDVSICLKCNHVAIFTGDGKLREARPHELRKIMADERIAAVRAAVSLLHVDKRRPH